MARLRQHVTVGAAEVADSVLDALKGGRLVERFVDSYVAEFDRRGLKTDPIRCRELLATLGREALLAVVAQVHAELPQYLTARRPATLRGPEVQVAAAFSRELLDRLERTLHWTDAEAEEFRRDLDLYAQIAARAQRDRRPRRPSEPLEGPFVDRCALLLDPSMLEKAQRAAGKLLIQLERAAEKALAGVFPRRTR